MGAPEVSLRGIAAGSGVVTLAGVEFRAVSIDRAGAFDRDVFCICGGKQHDVAVAARNAIARRVVLDVGAAKESSLRSDMKGDMAFQLHRPDNEVSNWDNDCPAAFIDAGIDRCLHCGGIESRAIALRAEIADVIDARTWALLQLLLGCSSVTRAYAERCCSDCRSRHPAQPLPAGESLNVSGVHDE